MNLVYITALIAVCSAAKLDRTYLPPASAKTAGGSSGDIQTPLVRDYFNPGQSGLPKGAVDNEYDGVVVEAAAPGTRASSSGDTGLGASRISYGSTHSKVGGAAFKTNQQGYQPGHNIHRQNDQIESQTLQNFQQGAQLHFNTGSPRPQSIYDQASNTIRFENNVGSQAYNYAFETDNGITAEENGVAVNGIQAEGGYSYTGDDGKFYKVTYTAGDGGYHPTGDHLPTPPPIPDEILKSLEQNAKEAAEGYVDDGSYDAAKYNTEVDYTKSDNANGKFNNRQPAFGKTPESDADVSGTFINHNTQAFDNSNVREQFPSSTYKIPIDDTLGNNVFGSLPNSQLKPTGNTGFGLGNQHFSAGDSFEQSHNVHGFNNFGILTPDIKETSNQENAFSSNDEYSRPINIGSTQLNQGANDRFGNKQSYLPPSNNLNSSNRQSVTVNFDKSQTVPQTELGSSSLGSHDKANNLNQNPVGIQSRPQPINQLNKSSYQSQSINSQFSNNVNLSKNKGPSEIQNQYNSFNNIHSTLQPSAELTTPFENFSNQNKQTTSSHSVLTPTQASFSEFSSPNSQSYNVPQSTFGTTTQNSNNNVNLQFNKIASQQGFLYSSDSGPTKLNSDSQYQGPDHSYHYNQPSKPFHADRVTPPTFTPGNSHFASGFQSSISTKYPRPPTVASLVSNTFSNTAYNQYSNTPKVSSFASQNERFRPSANYPKSTVASDIVPAPTSPTEEDGNKFPEQYTGITQAAASPFPSTSATYTSSSQNAVSNSLNNLQQGTTFAQSHNKDNVNVQVNNQGFISQTTSQVSSVLHDIPPQIITSQQYDGEIYEYNKPAESLSTPSESDENITVKPTNDFPQFGQKIRPTLSIQTTPPRGYIDSQTKYNSGHQRLENQPLGTKPESASVNLQNEQNKFTQDRLSTSDSFNRGLNDNNKQAQTKPVGNLQSFDKSTTQTTTFTSGAFSESQPTIDYNSPLGFSSRIRTCCQGPRTSSAGSDLQNPLQPSLQDQPEFDSGNSQQFGQQNTNKRPGLVNENSFNTQSIGFPGSQNTHSIQATSQTFQTGLGEEFGGPRRPPSFDEASGYHY